ncbi:exonuclease-like protein [Alkaliphilus metalliredigens QYMF]|uniref:Exonuclease-like protein n=1 Tax=Alkaliphilus metalliredigens (strain QYMF) TaxID=293826 RepID=A6TQ90_ALKMQ|nr:ribonuclease H-like domain-containing protein [Alkaliphilus metalliredigens]ABR48358.1 exonuclease-like protein [Alkaliphilus metalliredigens QYMF]
MKVKTYFLKEQVILPQYLKMILNSQKYCIVDIETTGLSKIYHHVILIGILYPVDDHLVLKQFFAEDPKEEALILEAFEAEFKDFDTLITYNGVTFDYPFLIGRFKKHNVPFFNLAIQHIDILQHLRRYKHHLDIPNLKLKTVETYLGIFREDEISGKESVDLYNQYTLSRSIDLENKILLHNYEDIYYLGKIISVFNHFPRLQKYEMDQSLLFDTFEGSIRLSYHPSAVKISKNILTLKGKTSALDKALEKVYYLSHYQFQWQPDQRSFELTIPLFQGLTMAEDKCYFVDLSAFNISPDLFTKDTYGYLPVSGQYLVIAIHKDIYHAALIDFINILLGNIFM